MTKKKIVGILFVLFAVVFCFSFYWRKKPATSEFNTPFLCSDGEAALDRVGIRKRAQFAQKETLVEVLQENLLEEVLAVVRPEGPFDRERFALLLGKLVRSDPDAAARFSESLDSGEMREEALRGVAQGWSIDNPADAENWATQLSNEDERKSALAEICFQVAKTDPAQAVQKAEHYELGAMPGAVLENLAQQWAVQNFSGAADWIKKRPPGEQRDQLFGRLAFVQSETPPEEAARLVVEQIPAGSIQTEAVISVLYQWARRDMAGAKAWVELFPSGTLRNRAENELVSITAYRSR